MATDLHIAFFFFFFCLWFLCTFCRLLLLTQGLRLCPLLNGTMKADNGAAEHGGFGNYSAPTTMAGSPE